MWSKYDVSHPALMAVCRRQLQSRAKEVIKALHFYDCNRDGHITRHEFRKVLEASGLKLTDKLFDKWVSVIRNHHDLGKQF